MHIHRKLSFGLCLAMLLVALPVMATPPVSQEIPCEQETVRQEFAADVSAGTVSPSANYAACSGNTYYEQIYNCGYHPQAEVVSCPVQIKRPTGYGAFGAWPLGSFEYVQFCFDCDQNGTWDYQTLGFVHTTNDVSGTAPPWWLEAHATTFAAPQLCTNDNGTATTVRATLSWNFRPTGCNFVPYWGNILTFQTRKDP